MPSSQTPPAGATALDPTAVRPDIDDARIVRIDAGRAARDARGAAAPTASRCCSTSAASTISTASRPLRRRLPSAEAAAQRGDASRQIGTPERVRVLCGVPATRPTVPTVTDLWPSRPTGPSARSSTCSASRSTDTPICGASRCPTTGKAIRCARTTRCAVPRASARRGRRSRSSRTSRPERRRRAAPPPRCRSRSPRRAAHDIHAATDSAAAAQSGMQSRRSGDRRRGDARELAQQPVNLKTEDEASVTIERRAGRLRGRRRRAHAATAWCSRWGRSIPRRTACCRSSPRSKARPSPRPSPEIGYLHTGIEKSAENLFWSQASTVIERMDYLSPLTNALCYYLAVEKLLGIDDAIPPRAQAGARAARASSRASRRTACGSAPAASTSAR